jgi:uncharacterized protein
LGSAKLWREVLRYFVETFDHLDRESLRHTEREKHLAFLAEHADKLIACGAKLNDDGSEKGGGMFIFDTEDRAEAEALVAADPFMKAHVIDVDNL